MAGTLAGMARLIYSAIASLDGYVADEHGGFGWAAPDEEVHAFINELERSAGTYLYGRRMYDTMLYWETAEAATDQSRVEREYTAIWQEADKIVFSRTLTKVSSARTRLVREFDPAAVRAMKDTQPRDITVGGPGLAANALAAGLVDELHLFIAPVVVGGGTRFLPERVRLTLDTLDQRRFDTGMVYVRYDVALDH